jgi:hypothetical protein
MVEGVGEVKPSSPLTLVLAGIGAFARAADLPIFDAHLHYSHDAWGELSAKEAIALLRKAGVRRGMVSSSDDEGTQRLYAEAPNLIVPELRPYRKRGEIGTWVRDQTIVAYVEERLKKYRYFAIGEFHLFGADADLPVPRRMVELARQYKILLHAHSDADAIERLFRQDPEARILWAHAGFERPDRVRELLRKQKNLWADLAFRTDHGSGGNPPPEWREAFLEFPTASWSAPTPTSPSAGTTCPSTRRGRARGCRRYRRRSPSGSRTRTAKR